MQWIRTKGIVPDVQHWLYFEQQLVRGQKYRVVRPFPDFPTDPEEGHKEWYFVGTSFSHYDGIVNVFVEDCRGQQWCMEFDEKKRDSKVTENFKKYVARVDGEFRADLFATSRCIDCLQALDASRPGWCPACHLVWEPA